jgi:hypothetical protein
MASKNAGDARNRSKKADDIRIQNMNAAKGNFPKPGINRRYCGYLKNFQVHSHAEETKRSLNSFSTYSSQDPLN